MENFILATQTGGILGPFAWILGKILEFIYDGFAALGIYNIGFCIILFTIVVRMLMLPMTIKQQKFTKLNAAMNPEIQEIQKKYAHDQQKMNEAMQELYAKEKFNPLGGCLPMLIQFPIIMGLFALLRNPMQYLKSEDMLFAVHESFLWIKDLAQPDLWILPIAAAAATYFSFTMIIGN